MRILIISNYDDLYQRGVVEVDNNNVKDIDIDYNDFIDLVEYAHGYTNIMPNWVKGYNKVIYIENAKSEVIY